MSSILLVDDNPADRAMFRVILGRAGFLVQELASGSETIAQAKLTRPHLIVLDINLPDTDGRVVCKGLKTDPDTSGIPVLILTVRHNENDVITGLESGADDYVAKDEPPPVILARIQRLLRYRQMAVSAMLNEQLAQVGRLLAGIVHEIRGPLSVLRGHAELLDLLTREDPELQEWVEPILRNAKLLQVRLTHLMAAVRTRPNRDESSDLVALAHEAVDLFLKGSDPQRPPTRVEIRSEVDRGAMVPLDPGRLLLVLLNLLNNADDAIRESGRLDGAILVRIVEREPEIGGRGELRLELSDNGPGIPVHALERIMEPFYTTKAEGSGYGLYLSSELVAEMGGRLEAENLPEGGARFSIVFPAASEPSTLSLDLETSRPPGSESAAG
ncbi:MAG: response regulator [Isosphaeraceae bacterium]|nr:response regulator [Isosphaeraceae bacterium]